MPTIQYSARSGTLSVYKLFTSCIRRCLVSRACDWLMSALSAVSLIFSFQFRSAFLPCQSAKPHSCARSLPNIGYRTLPKTWVGFLCRVYSPMEWFYIDSNGKMQTGHPVEGSFGSEFRAICNHCVVMAAWSREWLKFWEIFTFFENAPLR